MARRLPPPSELVCFGFAGITGAFGYMGILAGEPLAALPYALACCVSMAMFILADARGELDERACDWYAQNYGHFPHGAPYPTLRQTLRYIRSEITRAAHPQIHPGGAA